MLTQIEEDSVSAGFCSSDHDYFARAATVGEPFLRRDLLCYFDGRRVEVIGIPLNVSMTDAELRGHLGVVIDEWQRHAGVAQIDYLGPIPMEMPISDVWPLAYSDDPFDSNIDVFIDLTRPVIDRMKLRQDVRRARRGIVTTVAPRCLFGYEHIALLETLVHGSDFGVEDASFLVSTVSILRHPATVCFEARSASTLVGFTVAHRYFGHTAMVVCAAFDRFCPGASDALYAAMLEHYQSLGARRLGLGYAFGPGLLRYKTKWGTPIFGRPFFQRTWSRRPLPDCDHWPWRLQYIAEGSECVDIA
jgi:hypothetical protein